MKYAADKNHSAVKYVEIGRMLNVTLIYKYQFCGCLHDRVEVFQRYPSPLKTLTCTHESLVIFMVHFIDWNRVQKILHTQCRSLFLRSS